MPAHVSSRRRWFLARCSANLRAVRMAGLWPRDISVAYDWRPSGWSVLRQQEAAAKPQRRDVEYNTGSIVIVPALLAAIDNRTGKMWDKGYVNCYEAVSPMEKDQRVGMSSARINAIGRGIQSCQRQLGAHALPHSSIPIPQAYLSKADTFV